MPLLPLLLKVQQFQKKKTGNSYGEMLGKHL